MRNRQVKGKKVCGRHSLLSASQDLPSLTQALCEPHLKEDRIVCGSLKYLPARSMSEGKSMLQRWQTRLSAFEDLTGKWRDVGLSALQHSPDASQLAALREAAVQSRRQLGVRTKEFARLPSEEKLTEMGSLIRMYQEHIDAVTKCENFAEKAFLELHGVVEKMVDPYPMMDKLAREKNTILGFVKAQDECDALRRSLAEYESELLELKNQEVTIERLQAELARAEVAAASRVEQSAQDASAELQLVLRQWQDREQTMQKDLKDAASRLAKAEADNRALEAQAAACRQRLDELAALREQEVDALVTELDDCHTRIQMLEKSARGNTDAASALETRHAALDQSISPGVTPVKHSEEQWNAKRAEEMEKALAAAVKDALDQQQASHEQELRKLREEVGQREAECAGAEAGRRLAADEAASLHQTVRSLGLEVSSRAEHVSALELECQALRESVRRLEGELRRHPGSASTIIAPVDVLDVPPPFGDHTSVGAEQQLSTSSADFLAVAAQRDALRQRLLSLEEASSSQIHGLTVEVHRLQDECGKLRGLLRLHQQGGAAGIPVRPGEDDEMDHRSLAELSKMHGNGVATREATIRFLDGFMQVLQKHVLTNLQLRRLFLGYLVFLHAFMALSVLKRIVFG